MPTPFEPRLVDDYLLSLAQASVHTRAAYRRDLAQFTGYCESLGEPFPLPVDSHLMRGFLAHLHRQGLAARSMARNLSAVRGLFEQRFGEHRIASGNELTSIAHGLALIGSAPDLAEWTVSEEDEA